ncbi:hypothetical protein SO802_010926 [Lithocarpus litseifolius]|uniref:Uncharacterized protein n=1 Tax=Lithocarpus litseifolius TaxID=425828 RepID=A0AAW2DH13_9ROSI
MNIGSFLSIALYDEQELLPLPTDECYFVLKNGILAFAKVDEAYKHKKYSKEAIEEVIGRKPSNITSRIYDQLSNLRCRTLGDYKWYEDVFTTRVMNRSDCNSPFWKEKFINGLPTLFAEKVKETLCNSLGEIDYDNLTYGDISSTIRSVGMKMCRDFKIQSQANRNKAEYEMGTFSPSKKKSRRKESPEKPHRRRTVAKFYRKREYRNPKDELDHIERVSTSSSSDHELYQPSSSEPSKSNSSSSGPRIELACKDNFCRNKSLSTLSKKEESIINLIEHIADPLIKAHKLAQFDKIKSQSKVKDRTLSQDLDTSKVQGGILINPKYHGISPGYLTIIPSKKGPAKNPVSDSNKACILHKNTSCIASSDLKEKNVFSNNCMTKEYFVCSETEQTIPSPTSKWKMAKTRTKGKEKLLSRSILNILNSQGLQNNLLKCMKENLDKDSYGINSNFPYPTKTILDLLRLAYMLHNTDLFQRTLKTLKNHLQNLEERNDHITSLLSGKEKIRSKDKTVLMGTCFARLRLKTQASVRSAFANLPSEIQVRILGSKVMTESLDLSFRHFRVMITTKYPNPDEANKDIAENALSQSRWEANFGSSLRVYERKKTPISRIINQLQ